jgi:hypothetical protein
MTRKALVWLWCRWSFPAQLLETTCRNPDGHRNKAMPVKSAITKETKLEEKVASWTDEVEEELSGNA